MDVCFLLRRPLTEWEVPQRVSILKWLINNTIRIVLREGARSWNRKSLKAKEYGRMTDCRGGVAEKDRRL